ncbi:hypothetical protein L1987_09183 [Smallanthus sonchifolius]|uniref:Uncharacterized protein n=1 Tax=Smallanthus sonchifolius TaxID=185202 RepID=A0ACB9JN81_9ASTR|nr:hypothetical protein L1987_09183 [Smallanthus sonchifolius]
MRAIGDIIQLHSPDVICLQEVTPDIYAIFQRSNRWKSYRCSLSIDKANSRPYLCMQKTTPQPDSGKHAIKQKVGDQSVLGNIFFT